MKIGWKSKIFLINIWMKKIPTDIDVGTLSPRLYLEEDVIQGLERYQYEFKKPSMVRVYRLSNAIKLVIFASYLKINEV